jgi:hypothetical protein
MAAFEGCEAHAAFVVDLDACAEATVIASGDVTARRDAAM